MSRLNLRRKIEVTDVASLKDNLVNEIEVWEFGYVRYQDALDLGLLKADLDALAVELDVNIVHAVLTCGFFSKDRRVGSGLEGKSSKDVKRQTKKDLKKSKATN